MVHSKVPANINTRLQELPQELFDMIKNLTLVCDPGPTTRVIDRHYKPPLQLQINHQLRQKFMPIYYGTPAVWIFRSIKLKRAVVLLECWLNSISREARFHLQAVRAFNSDPRIASYSFALDKRFREWLNVFGPPLHYEFVHCWHRTNVPFSPLYGYDFSVVDFQFTSPSQQIQIGQRFAGAKMYMLEVWRRFCTRHSLKVLIERREWVETLNL